VSRSTSTRVASSNPSPPRETRRGASGKTPCGITSGENPIDHRSPPVLKEPACRTADIAHSAGRRTRTYRRAEPHRLAGGA
jgi:hypothetical protein